MNHVANKFANLIWTVLVLGAFIAPRLAQAQTYTDLHDFNPGAGDPHTFIESNLAQGRDGNFYTESNGGGSSGNGTVCSRSRAVGRRPSSTASMERTDRMQSAA